jgi:hypothetical protein
MCHLSLYTTTLQYYKKATGAISKVFALHKIMLYTENTKYFTIREGFNPSTASKHWCKISKPIQLQYPYKVP